MPLIITFTFSRNNIVVDLDRKGCVKENRIPQVGTVLIFFSYFFRGSRILKDHYMEVFFNWRVCTVTEWHFIV